MRKPAYVKLKIVAHILPNTAAQLNELTLFRACYEPTGSQREN
jgi:hypothetical protein